MADEQVVTPNQIPQPIDKEKLAQSLWTCIKKFEREDENAYRRIFNECMRGEHYWNNRQFLYKNAEKDDTWQVDDESQDYYSNIYRANGESIIAAMAVAIPQVDFYPDDADNPDDISTAQAYKKIATLINKHNKSHTLVARILYVLYTQGLAAVYNYNYSDKKFGTYKKEKLASKPILGEDIDESGEPVVTLDTVQTVVGISEEPKSRELIKVFGPLHVKVAPYIQEQEDTPYLILEFERHPAFAKKRFEDIEDFGTGSNASSEFEREQRALLYRGDVQHLDTWKCVWLRPCVYDQFKDEVDIYTHLEQNYPKGIALIFVNNTLADIRDENLDDHWTLTHHPLATYIHAEPQGKPGIPLQDAENELLNLGIDTVKHGIPQTFASSELIDFNAYANSEIKPGTVFPTKTLGNGRSISELIHTTKTATLAQEYRDLKQDVQSKSQLTSGAFPSIYGGNVTGSRTASEYAQSRGQALQRLSITWTMVKQLWADVMSKTCVSFARNMQEDMKQAIKGDNNSFINVVIKRAELNGRLGSVEPDPDEQLPVSWAQQRDVLMRMLEFNNEMVNEVIRDPNNSTVIKNALGFKELKVPGADDRLKQLFEIKELLNAGVETSTVMVDEMVDDHALEADVCRNWLISEVGLWNKVNNPQGYGAVLQHFVQHQEIMIQRAQSQMQQQEQQQVVQNKSNKPPNGERNG